MGSTIEFEGVEAKAIERAFMSARNIRRERALREMRLERLVSALAEEGLIPAGTRIQSQDPAGVLDDISFEILKGK